MDRISKRFGAIEAVSDISFDAQPGEILGFLGPNGAGKTTTLRMIMGILRPDQGGIRYGRSGQSGKVPKSRVGYLPEERGLYDDARVMDILVYFAQLKDVPRSEARDRATKWLDRLDLEAWGQRKVAKLSKGMQQKVQFIAAMLHEPDLVVFDEPFSGLDPVFQDLFKGIIREQREEGKAILLSSHQMNRVEELCDRILLIHAGREVLRGPLQRIREGAGFHVVSMRFSGDASFLRGHEGISRLALGSDLATFVLDDATAPDSFVRSLPPEIVIREMSIQRPPLHDIFVRAVEGTAS